MMDRSRVKQINQSLFIPRADNQPVLIEVDNMLGEKSYIAYGQYKRKEVQGMAFGRSLYSGAAVFVMLLSVVLVVVPQPGNAALNPVPVLTLRLDPSSQPSQPTESSIGSVMFTGTATIDKFPVERLVATLNPSCDQGWVSIMSPTTMVFTSTTPQTFTVSVVIPQDTPNNIQGKLTVDGRAIGGGLQSNAAQASAIITVDPYYRVNIETDAPYREIQPGSQVYYSFRIVNMGNAVDSFSLEISNLRDLVAKKWTVTLSSTTVPKVNPKEYKVVKVVAQSPRDWAIWKNEPTVITLKVTSQNAESSNVVLPPQSFPVYAYERGFSVPGFDPIFLFAALAIGIVFLRKSRQ